MNKNHWDKWYGGFNEDKPSPFCQWFVGRNYSGSLIELGAGNGRDLKLLSKHFKANGIDQSFDGNGVRKITIEDYIENNPSPDVVYTRFVWHSIDDELQEKIIDWCRGVLVIEARTDKGEPTLYTDHERNLVNVEKLKEQLKNYHIIYCRENTGWAKYKDENPPVVRLIARYESNRNNN